MLCGDTSDIVTVERTHPFPAQARTGPCRAGRCWNPWTTCSTPLCPWWRWLSWNGETNSHSQGIFNSNVTPPTLEMLLHLKWWILLKCQQCIQLPRDSWFNLARGNWPCLGTVERFSKIIGLNFRRICHALEYIYPLEHVGWCWRLIWKKYIEDWRSWNAFGASSISKEM